MARAAFTADRSEPGPLSKLLDLHWPLLVAVIAAASLGIAMLYSVAGGSWDPWASRQTIHVVLGLVLLIVAATIDVRVWMALAYPAYAASFALLIVVEAVGRVGKGAQRWIDLGFFQLQPSELMKIALVLALARFFHGKTYEEATKLKTLAIPLLMIGAPVVLVLMQPNLGTAAILSFIGASILFATGLRWWIILSVAGAVAIAVPTAWEFVLRDYQKERVYTFLDPERDPQGAGYNIIQSKIAMGSGGLTGKGYLDGTQSQLDFLPEKHTDFIFVMLGEELGLMGTGALMLAYLFILGASLAISVNARSFFGRVVALGLAVNFLAYILINTAMVMGLIPVVGIPLPLMSYGGTAMLTVMIGFGLIMSIHVHRNRDIPRSTGYLF